MKEKRVVIDTNIVVSAFLSGGHSHKILKSWLSKDFVALVSDELKDEINEVLKRPAINLFDKKKKVLLGTLFNMALLIRPKRIEKKIFLDPDDHFLLELAITVKAYCIVTGDQGILAAKMVHGVRILTPAAFCDLLSS